MKRIQGLTWGCRKIDERLCVLNEKTMTKFKNKYRIESNRMPGWDYSGNGFYFIRMMFQNRECILGKIENNEMTLSDFGKIAQQERDKSFEIRKELILDEFQMMPNHLHTIIIIIINQHKHNTHVETNSHASLRSGQSIQPNQPPFYRKPKSISSFVAGYKSAVITKINDFIDLHNLPIEKYYRITDYGKQITMTTLFTMMMNIGE